MIETATTGSIILCMQSFYINTTIETATTGSIILCMESYNTG